MTERLADIGARVQSLDHLAAVVTAMRGIAASRAQQGRAILPGIKAYDDVVSEGINQALLLGAGVDPSQREHERLGLVLFCAELGLAGAFTRRVLEAARKELDHATVILVGDRGAAYAAERGHRFHATVRMATHADTIAATANRVTDALYEFIQHKGLNRIDVLFSRFDPGGPMQVERRSLLPLDTRRFEHAKARAIPPLVTLPPAVLLERLISEYVFAQLCEATAHSFTAENESRIETMTNTKTNVEKMLTTLATRERQVRQEAITAEIVELTAGREAFVRARRQ